MAQTILMIFDKFDVHYWLDYGKNSFLFKQEGSKGEREGGRALRKEGSRRGISELLEK